VTTGVHGWPWGENRPTLKRRIVFASVVASAAAVILYVGLTTHQGSHTDFDQCWFAARAILQGRNPYALVGPGLEFEWPYPLYYPVTALIFSIPFTIFTQHAAAIAFVSLSTFALAFGSTRDGWHRLPLFASAAFIDSVMTAQWSIIMAAAVFIPWLGFFAVAKPQIGIPVVCGSRSSRSLSWAVSGIMIAMIGSFVLFPSWMSEWIPILGDASHILSPLGQAGGFVVLLLLARWRRPEAWMVILLAALPQTLMWYSVLILLAVADTYREACFLSLVSTSGYVLGNLALAAELPRIGTIIWFLLNATAFWPVVFLIMRRPNTGPFPHWSIPLGSKSRNRRPSSDSS